MKTGRLEAFSDGVLAIIITIMVLEMKVPQGYGHERFIPRIASFPYLPGKFYLPGDLLEQSPSPAASNQ